ncbi:MAG: ribosome silencing factor [Acidobacteria bacterium]|nr:ribosome silencing factor [Acidobacteriota bacterium]
MSGDLDSRDAAVLAARACGGKQAKDVRILEVRDLIVITDYFVIASGATDRQVKAIVDGVEQDMRAAGRRPVRREGERDLRWVLLDFVDVVVHVFLQEERDYYELERLWKDAPLVPWEEPPAEPRARGARSRA